MKLYTEEHVRSIAKSALAGFGIKGSEDTVNAVIAHAKITPIELPSDADIEVMSKRWGLVSETYLSGAKYVKEQILKQIES